MNEDGIDALPAVPRRGRPAQLEQATLAQVRNALIERMHGVRFSQAHAWRILGALGFRPQKPDKRAIERDEDTVRRWKRST